MHSGGPLGPVIGPLLFNLLPDVLEARTLLFVNDVKIVTTRAQNMSLHSSLTAAWDWLQKWDLPINPARRNYRSLSDNSP